MHYKKIEDLFKELGSGKNGLSSGEAESRLQKYGLNEIKEGKKVSALSIFLNQFRNVVIWVLIFATALSAFLGEWIDVIVVAIIIVLIAVLGFFMEYKAERAIDALKKFASLKATVIRNGQKRAIDSKNLVLGDIIALQTGDKVPADSRLIEIVNLQTQEGALTGESTPIAKELKVLDEKTPLADRRNMAFSGTIIVGGRAVAIVVATGMNTEIGKIATMIEDAEREPTPLQKKMDKLGKLLGKFVIGIAIIITIVGMIFQDKPFLEMIKFAAAVAVAAIPEALAGVVTITLSLGTKRMLKKNALVRRLPSVETLGSTTVICTDKTGTLTLNKMTVRKIYANGKVIDVTGAGYDMEGQFLYNSKEIPMGDIELLLRIGALNNDADLKGNELIGDPTEGALIVSAGKKGLSREQLFAEYKRIDEIEFTSERKMMTTIHQYKKQKFSYVKGAPEMVLDRCDYALVDGKAKKLSPKDKKEILKVNMEFAGNALRVLGFAFREFKDKNSAEKSLIFVGLQAMIDPPREEVKPAIEKCNKAGIKVIMITGDHEITAKAIAQELGLQGRSITGQQLDEIKNLQDIVEDIAVFARVNPQHKIQIVDALKKKGHIVAMTGDGVNDAPALKKADIGIAMGITGTDVAKEASAMILLDDNFASIVNAVEEGRGIYDNIKKYLGFLLSGNIGEVMIVFLGIIFGLPLALTATQILLINLVTDGLPALALTTDPFEPNAMSRKPRKQDESIFKGLKPFLIYYPIAQVATALSIFVYVLKVENNVLMAQTAAFLTIGMFEIYQSLASRSTIYPAIKVGLFKNKWLILAFVSSFLVISTSIFMPKIGDVPYGEALDMIPLNPGLFWFIVAISSLGAIIIEISKYFNSRKEQIGY